MNTEVNKFIRNKEFIRNRSWKGITVTNQAAIKIRKLMKENPLIKGLLLDVKKTGCAGFSYTINPITSNFKKEYLFFKNNGITIFVFLKSMSLIDGTEIDYVYKGLNQAFKFNNPQAKNFCGCGESFNTTVN